MNMPGDSAWLAQVTEAVLEPGLVICDAHHHLWDYSTSHYELDEFYADIGGGHNITKTVFVECLQKYLPDGPQDMRPVGETQYIDRLGSESDARGTRTRVAAGIIGFADLALGQAVQPVLEAHLEASDRFRGIRHASAWDSSERVHNAHTKPLPELLRQRNFREGFACLEPLGLSFDSWVYHHQLPELIELAKLFPGTTIVLDHVGGPLGIGPYAGKRDEVFAEWQQGIAALAQCKNVLVKLGGLSMTMTGFGWHKRDLPPNSVELAESMAPYFHACIENFGVDRCMFESNFPVDRASCSYTVLWNAFKRVSADYSETERTALFHDTASRVYRLEAQGSGPIM